MEAIITALIKGLVGFGPIGMVAAVGIAGWAAAAWLVVRQIKRKDKVAEKADKFAKELHLVHEKYVDEISKVTDKHSTSIAHLNEKHNNTVAELTEDRIRDLKANADDYHELAQNILQALDRLSIQFQISRAPQSRGDSDD